MASRNRRFCRSATQYIATALMTTYQIMQRIRVPSQRVRRGQSHFQTSMASCHTNKRPPMIFSKTQLPMPMNGLSSVMHSVFVCSYPRFACMRADRLPSSVMMRLLPVLCCSLEHDEAARVIALSSLSCQSTPCRCFTCTRIGRDIQCA